MVALIDASIKLGQKANVSYDALPNDSASGTVSAIAPTGTSTQGVVTYDVDITLDKIDPRLRPNMSCSVDIVVETKESALVVPTSALRTDSTTKKKYVILLNGTNATQADVTTGLVVGTNTEILTGLKEGDTIVTSYATSTTSSILEPLMPPPALISLTASSKPLRIGTPYWAALPVNASATPTLICANDKLDK